MSSRTEQQTNVQVVMTDVGGPEHLDVQRAARPSPRPGRVVVQVEAAGVSYAEVQLLRGLHPFPSKPPCVPGYDLVGRIVDVGHGVWDWRVGQRVAAMPRKGAWQQYIEVDQANLASVPEEIDAAEAVALVCNGVTAWQMLHRRARVRAGDTILVHGAGGGVGSILTALAVGHGVRVIGTASAAKHDLVRSLGAVPIDYRSQDVPATVRALAPKGVDAVFDHIGGPGLDQSWSMLAPSGTLVSYDSSVEGYPPGKWFRPHVPAMRRVLTWKLGRRLGLTGKRRATMYYVKPGADFRSDLSSIFDLLIRGELSPKIDERFPLTDAAEAVRRLGEGRSTGKIVLIP